MTLDDYCALPWSATAAENADGDWAVRVQELADFRFYATGNEELALWTDALRAHLSGYMNVGREIPIPATSVVQTSPTQEIVNRTAFPESWESYRFNGQLNRVVPLTPLLAA
jgi:hypothetical protein